MLVDVFLFLFMRLSSSSEGFSFFFFFFGRIHFQVLRCTVFIVRYITANIDVFFFLVFWFFDLMVRYDWLSATTPFHSNEESKQE